MISSLSNNREPLLDYNALFVKRDIYLSCYVCDVSLGSARGELGDPALQQYPEDRGLGQGLISILLMAP